MFDSSKPATRSPLLYFMVAACVLALVAAVYLTFFAESRAAGARENADPTAAADAAARAADLSGDERKAMEAIVRDYILTHPEIITEAVDVLQTRDTQSRLTDVRGTIETPFPGAVAGNPDGSRVLVEFFDYACGYCRASVPDLERLIATDRDVKVVFRELPILGEGSQKAARMALAAARQGRYKAFHDAMYAAGKPTDQAIEAAARRAGLDLAAARGFASSDAATRELQKNLDLARRVGFNGTPTWVVGDRMLEGAVGYDSLKEAVDDAPRPNA